MAFRVIDLAVMTDGSTRALVGTDLARTPAFAVAAQPVENPKAPGDREPSAKRTEILTVELAIEGGDQ